MIKHDRIQNRIKVLRMCMLKKFKLVNYIIKATTSTTPWLRKNIF